MTHSCKKGQEKKATFKRIFRPNCVDERHIKLRKYMFRNALTTEENVRVMCAQCTRLVQSKKKRKTTICMKCSIRHF